MAQKVHCAACGKSMRLPEGDAGAVVVCLACGTKFVTPRAGHASDAGGRPQAGPVPTAEPVPVQPVDLIAEAGRAQPDEALPARPPRSPVAPLAWAAVGVAALVLVGVLLFLYVGRSSREAGRRELAAMLAEAQGLIAQGDLRGAHQKYRELDRRAVEIGADDPDVKTLADQARSEQEDVYAVMLANLPPAAATPPNPATPPPPGAPATPSPAAAPPTPAAQLPTPGVTPASQSPAPGTSPASSGATTRPTSLPETPAGDASARRGVADDASTPTTGASASTTRVANPATTRGVATRKPLAPQTRPAGVDDVQIGLAIQKGVDFLVGQFDEKTGKLRPVPGIPGGNEGYVAGLDALCVYALLQSGQSLPDPRLDVRSPFMKSAIAGMKRLPADSGTVTYARALRATALAIYGRPEDASAIRADVQYLLTSHHEGRYTYQGRRPGTPAPAPNASVVWDNSNTQYGLLGVWSGAESGVEIPGAYWAAAQKHWATCQNADGTWGYTLGDPKISMTAAGTASLFVADDYLNYARFGQRLGREPFSPPLKKALDWWEKEDSLSAPGADSWGYTIYGIERVGLASGLKYFGKQDWYRKFAADALARQQPDGSWGDLVETSYALLFLARGRHPILMNKLRFDKGGPAGETQGYWGNRPRDVANLARYAGRQLERPFNWQVVSLAPEWSDWLDSPILSIASHRAPYFAEADVDKFRQYVEAGGMLFLHADGATAEFDAFAEALSARLFPQYPLRDLPPSHPLYSSVYKLAAPPAMKAVTNGSRILVLYSPEDVSRIWQLRDESRNPDVFRFGVNLFVYGSGKRELQNRLVSPYVPPPDAPPTLGTVNVARLKYDGAWDPEPGAWRRFASWFQRGTGTGVNVAAVSLDDLKTSAAPVAHLTGVAAVEWTPDHVQRLVDFVGGGGVLLVDTCGGAGAFSESVKAALAKALPDTPFKNLPADHPLLSPGSPAPPGMEDLSKARVRLYVTEQGGPASPSLQTLRHGTGIVLLTPLDLASGLLGTRTWGVYGYDPEYAQSLTKNVLFWTIDGKLE